MKVFFKIVLVIFLSLLPSLVGAQIYTETHYVTQNGSGQKTGRSPLNSWSISDFNNTKNWSTNRSVDSKIGPGDVVYFSGTFSSRVIVNSGGSVAGSITLDGYEAGNCDPLKEVCNKSALLQSGLQVGSSQSGPNYLIIQDFRMTRRGGQASFTILNSSNTIVRRNQVQETDGTMFYWYNGQNNVIEGNKFVHFGQNNTDATQGVNFILLSNSVVRNNEFGHDEVAYRSGALSANIIEIHGCHYMLFEYNHIYGAPSGSNIVPKEGWGGSSNLVVRFNKIHSSLGLRGGTGKGLYIRTRTHEINTDMYVYGNFIFNNTLNFYMGDVAKNVYFWSNIVSAGERIGIGTWRNNINGLHIYNNTIAYNNTSKEPDLGRGGIALNASSPTEYHIKNNILWNNHPGGEANRKQIYSSQPINSLEHNSYFHSAGEPTIQYNGGYRTLTTMKFSYGLEKASIEGRIEDPLFANPAGEDGVFGTVQDDYRLTDNSPVISKGAILKGTFSVNLSGGSSWLEKQTGNGTLTFGFDDALCPIGTDWTTNPPTVVTAKQGSYGNGWGRGAYVFKNNSNTQNIVLSPKNVILTPVN